jgi:hypothetical protein
MPSPAPKTLALLALLALSASSVAIAAPPADKPHASRSCFFHDELNGFSAPDQHTLYVRVSVNDVYRLETFGPCLDMDWAMRLALIDRGGGGWICVGDLADVVVPDPGIGRQRCPVRIVAKLTPDEVKALPKKSRP